MKVYIRNQQRLLKVNQQKTASLLRKALHLLRLHRAELSILFVNDRRMRVLNHIYRGVDRTTDVLSFPQSADFSIHDSRFTTHEFVLGDIVINLPRAKKQAIENGLTFNEELKRLLIHGLLHLIGFDHERNQYAETKMQKKTKEILNQI